MQGVSGSNPLGSIEKPNPTFLLRQVGCLFWTLLAQNGHRNGRIFQGTEQWMNRQSAMLRYREHQRLSERTQSKLKVESPREVFAHWVNIRVSPTPSKSRSPAGRMLLPQLRVSRHAGSLMGHVSFTELLGDIVHRSLPLRRLIRVY